MTHPLNTWISVKDAMPERHKTVVLWTIDYDGFELQHLGFHARDQFYRMSGLLLTGVTHWMLLSKPTTK